MPVRLQKYLADAGVASRRASEAIIVSGRVAVNGVAVTELGTKVDPAHDRVTVDGTPVKGKRKIYLALHKPAGCVCSRQDPLHRRTVGDLIPKEWHNLNSVGRLDFDSEGLIFLTNDGQFSLRLTHPRYGVRKMHCDGQRARRIGSAGPFRPGRAARRRAVESGKSPSPHGQQHCQRRGTGAGRREESRSAPAVRVPRVAGQAPPTNANRPDQTRRAAQGQMADFDRFRSQDPALHRERAAEKPFRED